MTATTLRSPASPLPRALGRPGHLLERATVHGLLLLYTAIALGPILLIVLNSLKEREAIFDAPVALPTPETFSLVGYETLLKRSSFESYFANSLVVTLGSMALVLLIGSMAAFASARCPARTAPAPPGAGSVMWFASAVAP